MKEIVNYIKESKNLHTLFGKNNTDKNNKLKIVIMHHNSGGESYWCVFNKQNDLNILLNKNKYSREETHRLIEIFNIAFNQKKWNSVLISPFIKNNNNGVQDFEFNENKKTYISGTREDTDLTINYTDFNLDYWRKQKWL